MINLFQLIDFLLETIFLMLRFLVKSKSKEIILNILFEVDFL